MKRFSNKTFGLMGVMAVKIVSSVLMLVFPTAFFEYLFPFGLYLPWFTAAVAYGGIPKAVLLCLLVLSAAEAVCLLVATGCLAIKMGNSKNGRILAAVVCGLDLLAFATSLVLGPLSLGKGMGLVFNTVVVVAIIMSMRCQGDGSLDTSP